MLLRVTTSDQNSLQVDLEQLLFSLLSNNYRYSNCGTQFDSHILLKFENSSSKVSFFPTGYLKSCGWNLNSGIELTNFK